MPSEFRSLRSQIQRVARSSGYRQRRYPDAVRQAAVDHARIELERGESTAAVAKRLGLTAQTLTYWLRSLSVTAPTAAMRPVSVQADSTHDLSSRFSQVQPVVVTPRGLRVEGLGLDEVAELLRRIG